MPRAALRHRSGERARRRMRSQIMRKRTNAPWRRPRHGPLQRTKNGRRLKRSKSRRQPKRRRRQPKRERPKRASSWRRSAWKRPGRRRRSNGKNRNDAPRRTKKSASMNATWQRAKAASPSKPPLPPGAGTCLLQGCNRPRFVESSTGRQHEFCGVTHAQQAKAMPGPEAFKAQGERKMQEMVQGMNRRATEGEIAQEGYQRQQRIQAAGMAASQDVERQVMQAVDQIQKPTNCTIEPCDQRVINEVKHLSKHVEQSSVTIAEAASMLQAVSRFEGRPQATTTACRSAATADPDIQGG